MVTKQELDKVLIEINAILSNYDKRIADLLAQIDKLKISAKCTCKKKLVS
jgi:hypothetical protein|tara:strand:- start:88 stop:237 length:150 start_codon:yes stop_codon:yes gene_type:complete